MDQKTPPPLTASVPPTEPLTGPPAWPDLGPRYRIVRELGRGGFGVVYLALATEIEMPCAIKLLHAPEGADAALPERTLRREAEAAVRVRTPHVAQWRDFGRALDGRAYVVFECCEGETLRQRLHGSRLSADQALDILRQIVEGVAEIHRAGIVHRDLKPANIMLLPEADGRVFVKILDFGLARIQEAAGGAGTVTTAGACSPGYAPPEYLRLETRAAAVTKAFDVFSVGAIAYELFAGKKAYAGQTTDEVLLRVVTGPPPRLADGDPRARRLSEVLVEALDADPARRPADLREWFARVEAAAREIGDAKRSGSGSGKRRLGVAMIFAVLVAAAIWFALGERPGRGTGSIEAGKPVFTAPAWAEILDDPPPEGVVLPAGYPARLRDRRTGIELLFVPAGETTIGDDQALYPDERPARRIRISKPAYLAETETTRRQWEAVLGPDGPWASESGGPEEAMTGVSWKDVQEFLRRAGPGIRLPSEALFEHAARAGRSGSLASVALPGEAGPSTPGDGTTLPAAADAVPNPWGFRGLVGGVWEWCQDGYDAAFFAELKHGAIDPAGPPDGPKFVQRGGSIADSATRRTFSSRASGLPDARQRMLGFRVAWAP